MSTLQRSIGFGTDPEELSNLRRLIRIHPETGHVMVPSKWLNPYIPPADQFDVFREHSISNVNHIEAVLPYLLMAYPRIDSYEGYVWFYEQLDDVGWSWQLSQSNHVVEPVTRLHVGCYEECVYDLTGD
jgi:hypothetical protein